MPNSVTSHAHRTLVRGVSTTGQATRAEPGDRADHTASPESPTIRPLSLRKNFGWSFLANCVYAASRWMTVVVLAKLGNTEMIGTLLLALAITNPIATLANLGLRTALVTDARNEFRFNIYFTLRLTTSLLALLGVCLAVQFLGYSSQTTMIIAVVAMGKFFESLSDISHGLFQQRERLDWTAFSLMSREPLILAVLAFGVYSTGNLLWGAIAYPLVTGGIWACQDLPRTRRTLRQSPRRAAMPADSLRPSWDFPQMLALARLALPAGIVLLFISLSLHFPRYMVEYYLGTQALGIFGAINSLTMSPAQLVMAMGYSSSSRLAKYHATGDKRAFGRLVALQLVFLICMGLAGVLLLAFFGHALLTIIYDPQIAAYTRLALYLMIATAILNCNGPLGRALDAMRCFSTHMTVRVLSLIILTTLLPYSIKAWGLDGAAWAMIASALTTTVIYVSFTLYQLLRSTREVV